MSPTAFRDLDELVLDCRDGRARECIREAVLAYRGGAYRAAIVSTWVAVAFDYVAKLNELALSGDKQAQEEVASFEAIQRKGDVVAALRWERNLLSDARDRFGLLSPVEFIDLERLQADRHRCAHPSMVSAEIPYAPTAELARSHLRSAIEALLRHPPVQGKAALDRLVSEIASEYFPLDVDRAVTHFEHGPLGRPRDSLVRNLLIVLLKGLAQDRSSQLRRAQTAALKAVRRMHPALSDQILSDTLPDALRARAATEPHSLSAVIAAEPDLWQFFPPDLSQMLERLIRGLPTERFWELDPFLEITPLRQAALARLELATEDELFGRLPFGESDPDIIRRMLEVYAGATSWAHANKMGEVLMGSLDGLQPQHVDQLLAAGRDNLEVRHSFQFGALLTALVKSGAIAADRLKDFGLEEVPGV